MVDSKEVLKSPVFISKCVEVAAIIVSLTLLQDIGNLSILSVDGHKKMFVLMVTGSYLLIVPMQIVGIFMEQKTPKNLGIFRAGVGAILWFSAAWMLFESYNNLSSYDKYVDSITNFIPGGKIISGVASSFMGGIKDQFFSASFMTAVTGCAFLAEVAVTYKWSETNNKWSFLPLFRK